MRKALGRGLDALLPSAPEHSHNEMPKIGVQKIPIEKIRPNRLQTRKYFDPEKLSELAQSIKQSGLAQPIIVTRDETTGAYELIAGERRLRACQLAEMTEIEAVVRNSQSDKDRLLVNMVENLQREDLNPIEEALGYLRLMKECSINQTQLTKIVGKSKSSVSNTLRLLELPEEVQKALQIGQIAEGHARAFLQVKNKAEIITLFHKTISQNLSVRDVEDYARRTQDWGNLSIKNKPAPAPRKPADILAMEQELQHILGTKISIQSKKDSHQGTISLHYFNLSDFEKIVTQLKK